MYSDKQYAEDLKEMVGADLKHLATAAEAGNRVIAHGHLDALITDRRLLEDEINKK